MPKPFTVVILTALQVEFKAVRRHLTSLVEVEYRGTVYETGRFTANDQEWQVSIAEIGAGNPGAAAAAERAIHYFDPTYIFFVGVAGGIKDVKLGDVVAATKIYGYESGKAQNVFQPRPNVGNSSHTLEQRARAEARKDDWLTRIDTSTVFNTRTPEAIVGPIAAGEKVVASMRSPIYKFIRANYGDAVAVEMEGSGFLEATHVNHPVEAIVIRGISDLIRGKSQSDAQGYQEIAARNASAFAFEMLAKLGTPAEDMTAYPESAQIPPFVLASQPPETPEFPIFHVPYRKNPNFTGRNDILTKLNENFTSQRSGTAPQVVTGLGGVGKTQVAIEYAYRYADQYDFVGWIRAEESATLSADYQTLTKILLLPVKSGAEQTVFVNIVRNWLENTSQRWLLIFDNVEENYPVDDMLPRRGNGHVLITSVNPDWRNLAQAVFHIPPFTSDEAANFLLRRTPQRDHDAGIEIAKLLGGLPLALEQAGAFISKLGLSFSAYVGLFKEQRQELWQRETSPTDYKATVTTTWELAFHKVKESSPAGTALLNLLAFLAPDDIPLSIFSKGISVLPSELARVVDKPFALEETIASLYQYSLVKREGDTLSIHRLVQEIVRDRLGSARIAQWVETAVNLIETVFTFDEYDLTTWPSSAEVLPHATAVVNHADQNQVTLASTATIWQKMGEYLRVIGEFNEAQNAIEHALALHKDIFEEDHPLVAKSMDSLGEVLQEQGQFTDAVEYHQSVLEMIESDTPAVARCHNNLGMVLQHQGKYEQAQLNFEQALAISRQVLGELHPYTATSLNNLGIVLTHEGKYEQAQICYEQALAITKQVLREQHPYTASNLNNLGSVLQHQGKYEQAQICFEQALAISRQVLGELHPYTANSLNNLGAVLQYQGKYEQAQLYHEKDLVITKQVLGELHPSTATTLNNLGIVLSLQGKYEQARLNLEQALAIRRQILGELHPDTANSLNSVGSVLSHQGKYEQARLNLEQALAIRRQILGELHPDTANSLNSLGSVLRHQGKYEQAQLNLEQALAIRRQILGELHPDTANSLHSLGGLFLSQGRYPEAKPYLEQALAIFDRLPIVNHATLVSLLSNLAKVTFRLKGFPATRQYMNRALKICAETKEHYVECAQLEQLRRQLPNPIGGKPKDKKKKKKR